MVVTIFRNFFSTYALCEQGLIIKEALAMESIYEYAYTLTVTIPEIYFTDPPWVPRTRFVTNERTGRSTLTLGGGLLTVLEAVEGQAATQQEFTVTSEEGRFTVVRDQTAEQRRYVLMREDNTLVVWGGRTYTAV